MKFGLMKNRVEVQQYTTVKDDWNHETKTWAALHTVWAEKKYKNSQLVSEVEGLTHVVNVIFRIRFIDGITTKMRIKEGLNFFDIVGMKVLGNQEVLELITIERHGDSSS